MSRDEVNCSSIILSVVAECSVKVFDDVGVFVNSYVYMSVPVFL